MKVNHNNLNEHFDYGGIEKLGHGISVMSWHTSKYIIKSTTEDNDFNQFVKIYRKSDGKEIFSGGWGISDY